MDYPTINPTEIENEFNFLADLLTQAYIAFKTGEIEEADYALIKEQIAQQKEILSFVEQ